MFHKLVLLRDEIEEEFRHLYELEKQLKKLQEKIINDSQIEKRVYASILSDFYMAIERIFKLIAKEIDDQLPEGDEWHKKLLRQMSVEIPLIRPAVITKTLFYKLEDYLKFRHLVRNIYGFQLEYNRFNYLIKDMNSVAAEVAEQVKSFLNDMQDIAKNI
ncbi:MAG: hypothetical protein CVU88_05925 [Firmicutes bacterium HGW-Firmicutes-13]|nr:MAG: hypothetical protein CVU88_05925 [Firmicutes bacterium HGW-Firmicutes-13]